MGRDLDESIERLDPVAVGQEEVDQYCGYTTAIFVTLLRLEAQSFETCGARSHPVDDDSTVARFY